MFTLSIFTIEADRRPILSLAAKKHREAEALLESSELRDTLASALSEGRPLREDLRLRLATADERVRYREFVPAGDTAAVLLVDHDTP